MKLLSSVLYSFSATVYPAIRVQSKIPGGEGRVAPLSHHRGPAQRDRATPTAKLKLPANLECTSLNCEEKPTTNRSPGNDLLLQGDRANRY